MMFPEMKVDEKDPNKDTILCKSHAGCSHISVMQELQKFFV